MPERDLKEYLLDSVKALGGEARKVRWEGRNFAPDWRVMAPGYYPFFVELKDTGKRPTVMQLRELARMKRLGERAYWANSERMLDLVFRQCLK